MMHISELVLIGMLLTGCVEDGMYVIDFPEMPCAGGYQLDALGQFIENPDTGAAVPCIADEASE